MLQPKKEPFSAGGLSLPLDDGEKNARWGIVKKEDRKKGWGWKKEDERKRKEWKRRWCKAKKKERGSNTCTCCSKGFGRDILSWKNLVSAFYFLEESSIKKRREFISTNEKETSCIFLTYKRNSFPQIWIFTVLLNSFLQHSSFSTLSTQKFDPYPSKRVTLKNVPVTIHLDEARR